MEAEDAGAGPGGAAEVAAGAGEVSAAVYYEAGVAAAAGPVDPPQTISIFSFLFTKGEGDRRSGPPLSLTYGEGVRGRGESRKRESPKVAGRRTMKLTPQGRIKKLSLDPTHPRPEKIKNLASRRRNNNKSPRTNYVIRQKRKSTTSRNVRNY